MDIDCAAELALLEPNFVFASELDVFDSDVVTSVRELPE